MNAAAPKTDGRKVSRPHAHKPLSAREIAKQRQADEARREVENYRSAALREAVRYLRTKMPVHRDRGGIRVGGRLCTDAQTIDIAARERRLEQPAPAMMSTLPSVMAARGPSNPRTPMARHAVVRTESKPTAGDAGTAVEGGHGSAPVASRSPARKAPDSVAETVAPTRKDGGAGERGIGPEMCRCGRPVKHGGRCWVRWGYDGPQERAIGKPRTKVCESCGGPRSYWSNGKCRKCYTRVPQQTQDQRIAALEAELAALKDHVRDAFAEVCEFVGMTGKGR